MRRVLKESHTKTILYGILLLVFATFFFVFIMLSKPLTLTLMQTDSQPLNDFEYSWGDSPKQSNGTFLWLENPASAKWAKRVLPAPAQNRSGAKTVWERVKLPDDF